MEKFKSNKKVVKVEETPYSIEDGAKRIFEAEQRGAIDMSSHTPSLDEQDGDYGDDEGFYTKITR